MGNTDVGREKFPGASRGTGLKLFNYGPIIPVSEKNMSQATASLV